MKNFIVLGGNGYLGSKLVDKLRAHKNHKVISISRKSNNHDNYIKVDLFKNYKWFNYINNKSIIFFLAFENNLDLFEKNYFKISKSYNLFLLNFNNYIKKKKLSPNIIFTSTVSLYPSSLKKIDEKILPDPTSWYDFNKSNFENFFLFFSKIHNFKFISLRLSNILGKTYHTQTNRGFLNKILSSNRNIEIKLLNSGKMYRDYLYLDDAIDALYKIGNNINKIDTGVYNLCSGKSIRIIDAIKLIKKKIKIKINIKNLYKKNKFHTSENRNFFGSNKLIRSKIQWRPEQNFKKIIDKLLKKYN